MSWRFDSSTGETRNPNGLMVARGYSGHGDGKNNPMYQQVHDVGPIPRGKYHMGEAFDSPTLGPVCIPLMPAEGTETFGRSGFYMHGDSKEHPGEASHGCVIQPKFVRDAVVLSADKVLEVV